MGKLMLMLEKQQVLPVTSKNISKQQKLIQIHVGGGEYASIHMENLIAIQVTQLIKLD